MGAGSAPEPMRSFLREQFASWPVMASSVGIEERDDELGDFSREAFERRALEEKQWRRRFEALARGCHDAEDAFDLELVLAALRGSAVLEDWGAWRRNPDVYLAPSMDGILTLFLHRRTPEQRLAEAAAARLEAVGTALEHARSNLEAALMSPVLAARAAEQCRSAAYHVAEVLPLALQTPRLRARVADAGVAAARAYRRFGSHLDRLTGEATGSFALGRDRYDRLLRERELLGEDAAALRERGLDAYETLRSGLQRAALRLGVSGGWRGLLSELRADCPRDEGEMQRLYESWTERARSFAIERRLVRVADGERCAVEPAPAFYRDLLVVPFHSWLPAFGSSRVGRLFVPCAPQGASDQERRDRLRFNSRPSIPSICVHESYPGHHWHALAVQANPRPVRKLFASQFFVEGWAVYVESLMGENGFYQERRQELGQLAGRMFRALRLVVDTGLHTGELSLPQACELLVEKGGVPVAAARSEVARYCSWPTQAAAYLAGAVEIERLRASHASSGADGLLSFHERLCALGAPPPALAERMLGGSAQLPDQSERT